mgnify:CR=1 FL=1
MKHLFFAPLAFISLLSFSQQTNEKDSIEEPKYDTTSIDIRSTNSFYFCSKLYKIPRDCDKDDQSNCCSFSAQMHSGEKTPISCQLGCYNGATLVWTYFATEDQARSDFEGYGPQIKKQMKSFKQTKISVFIDNQQATAYKLSYTSIQDLTGYEILSYAVINGQNVVVRLFSLKELKSSKDLQPIFQQIVKF